MTPRARIAAAAVLALAVACTPWRLERARTLPRDVSTPILYVALGDSTVEGVGASSPTLNYVSRLYRRLAAFYPAARVVNLGVAGATSADVVADQLPRAIALGPDLVTLSIGPNDITGRIGVDAYAGNVDRILATLAAATRAAVVVNLLPDLAVTPRFARDPRRAEVGRQTEAFNTALARAARAHGAELVDLYRPSRDEIPRRPELVAADGYHPSNEGYARWAALMWEGARTRIPWR